MPVRCTTLFWLLLTLTVHANEPAQPPPEPIGDAWSDPRNPIARLFNGRRLDLWSLKPLQKPAPPPSRTTATTPAPHPIDAFIRAKLDQNHLQPSPPADKRALARRLYLDLTGLPPSPSEMAAFLEDASPNASARLIDKLLASPAYGEHAARQWLDVVRYSDSHGFDWDEYRREAWRFRDYVIRSFNSDKPFDQFIREQLAGDELLSGPPQSQAESDSLIATGYLRMGPQDNSASLFDEQDRARAEWMADLTETTGSAFLGLTLSCCRCHDHKSDPISQADHYRLRAFFAPLRYANDLPLNPADEQAAIQKHNALLDEQLKPLQEQLHKLLDQVRERLRQIHRHELPPEELDLLNQPPETLSAEQKAAADSLRKQINPSDRQVAEALTEPEQKQRTALEREIENLQGRRKSLQTGLLATDTTDDIETTHVLFQGDHKAPRDPVTPGFLSALDPNPAPLVDPPNPKTTGRRLTLAGWIASEKNPLTARVLVNRIWQVHFGRGLVATPNDFGLAGATPTHPELLDWLAAEFMENSWSLKELHRLIVTSATYQQASTSTNPQAATVDPENRLYWRQNLRRLTAEQLRDSMLFVSGLMTSKPGGPPVWPDVPPEVLQANPAFLDDNEQKTKGWYPSPKKKQGARSVYLIQKRTVRIPFMQAFDLPSNETSCARRNESIVPPQAFSLLNNTLSIECAQAFARRLETEGQPADAIVRQAFAHAFQREPTAAELAACGRMIKQRGTTELCRALLNVNEFIFLD